MQRRLLLATLPAAAIWRVRPARAMPQPILAELFTSQSCDSCPAADALLIELIGARPDVLALSFHVTYWNRLGWRDRFSLPGATERQRRYAQTLREGRYPGQVYTPQLVIQGELDAIGSDRPAVLAALSEAARRPRPAAELAVAADGATAVVEIGPGAAGAAAWLVGYDARHVTEIGGGENRGRRLTHGHVVRSLQALPPRPAGGQRMLVPRGAGERLALLVQGADGTVLGAASG